LGYDRIAALSPLLAARAPKTLVELKELLVRELGMDAAEVEALVDPLSLAQGRIQ
jgi:hypothetical protein